MLRIDGKTYKVVKANQIHPYVPPQYLVEHCSGEADKAELDEINISKIAVIEDDTLGWGYSHIIRVAFDDNWYDFSDYLVNLEEAQS